MQKTFELVRDTAGNWATYTDWIADARQERLPVDFVWLCARVMSDWFPATQDAVKLRVMVDTEKPATHEDFHKLRLSNISPGAPCFLVHRDDKNALLPRYASIRLREIVGTQTVCWGRVTSVTSPQD